MTELLSSPNLFVIQSDSSIYHTLQTWLYYILNPDFKKFENMQQIANESSKYFQSIYGEYKIFLKLIFMKINNFCICFRRESIFTNRGREKI